MFRAPGRFRNRGQAGAAAPSARVAAPPCPL
jgi:hypothetical protein